MAYLIIRVEVLCQPPLLGGARTAIDQFYMRHRRCDPQQETIIDLGRKHGYEITLPIGPLEGPWPLTAIAYISPNRAGEGRCGSQVYRLPARKIEEDSTNEPL